MINFQICNFWDKNNELIPSVQDGNNACFAALLRNKVSFYNNDNKNITFYCKGKTVFDSFNDARDKNPGHVLYFCESGLDTKIIKWYSKIINLFGLTHTLKYDKINKTANFSVLYYGSQMKMMVTLAALRYLEEDDFPKMIKWFFENKNWAGQSLEKLFILFQLCHYCLASYYENNDNYSELGSNHALVAGFIGENYSVMKSDMLILSTHQNFLNNLLPNKPFYLNSAFFTYKNEKRKDFIIADLPKYNIENQEIPKLLQKGEIDKVVKILQTPVI